MKKPIIIFGSSRSNGNTFKAVELVLNKIHEAEFINLADYNVSDFDYEHKNKNDDFMKLIGNLLNYKTVILATPVYWYTMSATMKRFVDRLSDLLSTDKDIGKLLRKKNLAIVSSYSIHPEGKDGFEQIFINTAKYLDMNYLGCYFHYSGDDEKIIANNSKLLAKFVGGLVHK